MTSALKIAPGLELPLDVVTEATAIVATRGAGKSSASAVIVEEVFALGVQAVIFDRTGVYWGLRSNTRGDGPGLGVYVLGGPHGDVPLEQGAGVLIADLVVDSGHSFVLDLSDFSKSAAIRFTADFVERLYDRKARARTTTLLILDEAHFYAPQTPRGGFKGDSARLMGAMEDVVGLGRSRGLGVVLTTQRTQSLNKAILDLIETLLVMRMLSPRARDAVQDWIREKQEDDREGVLETLDSLPTGTAWVWSPLRGILQKVALRRIKTFDSYATPKPGEKRVEPQKRRELDLDALGDQMRATVERAKSEDPKQLRKTIAELRRDLTKRPTETKVETVTETVEVEVVGDRALERLEEAAEQLAGAAGKIVSAVNEISAALAKVTARRREPQPVPKPAHPVPARSPQRAGTPPPASRPVGDGEFQPTPAQQRILNALASLEVIGVRQPSKTQLALFAQASPKSSGYANNLGALRNQGGLIEYPTGGTAALTEAGRAIADSTSAPSTHDELVAYVRSLVGPARARIIDVLVDVYPDALPKDELAERAGASASSSGYANNLGSLRSLGLIDYPQGGYAAATPVLFLEAA